MASKKDTDEDFYREQVERNSKCSICLDIFKDPVITKCHHSFCRLCIEKQFRQAKRSYILCPICRKRLKVPKTPEEALPASHYALQNLDILNVHNSKCSPEGKCAVCTKEYARAKNFCRECGKLMCLNCTDIHNNLHPTNLSHKIIPLSEVKGESMQMIVDSITKTEYCDSHSDKTVVGYCRRCKKTICKTCEECNHRYHDKVPLADQAQEFVNQLNQCLEKHKPIIRKLEQDQTILLKSIEKLKQEGQRAKESVNESATEFHSLVDEMKENHLKEIDRNLSSQLKEIRRSLERIELDLTKHISLKSQIQNLQNFANHAQIVRDSPKYGDRFKEIEDEQDVTINQHKNHSLRFVRYATTFSRIKNGLGKVYTNTDNPDESRQTKRFRNSCSDLTSLTFANDSVSSCTSRWGSRSNSTISGLSYSASQIENAYEVDSDESTDLLKPVTGIEGRRTEEKESKFLALKFRYLSAASGKES